MTFINMQMMWPVLLAHSLSHFPLERIRVLLDLPPYYAYLALPTLPTMYMMYIIINMLVTVTPFSKRLSTNNLIALEIRDTITRHGHRLQGAHHFLLGDTL